MIKKVAAVAAAAGGLMLAGAGVAVADGTQVSKGPGVLSGNNVQVPVDIPVELCGNTISVLGDMNLAGGTCA
ncbi:chaplin [Streptomyces ovatisporus]|uniref:Chaplin n=1 Tax=Streptomyces ovatisporus TaxID=1128682 RepID=A0ABV9AGY0_9ACTN